MSAPLTTSVTDVLFRASIKNASMNKLIEDMFNPPKNPFSLFPLANFNFNSIFANGIKTEEVDEEEMEDEDSNQFDEDSSTDDRLVIRW